MKANNPLYQALQEQALANAVPEDANLALEFIDKLLLFHKKLFLILGLLGAILLGGIAFPPLFVMVIFVSPVLSLVLLITTRHFLTNMNALAIPESMNIPWSTIKRSLSFLFWFRVAFLLFALASFVVSSSHGGYVGISDRAFTTLMLTGTYFVFEAVLFLPSSLLTISRQSKKMRFSLR